MVAHGRGGPRWVAAGDPVENPLMVVANVGEGPCPRGRRGAPHHLEIAQCVYEVSQSAVAGGSHDDAMELRVEF
jgi:hypothetical protein